MSHTLQNAYRTTSKNLCAFCPDRCHYQVCPSHVTLHVRTLNWSEISKADVGMHDVRSWVEHLCQNDIRMCVSYIIEFFCVSNKNCGAKCSREEPHWENECKFTRTFSTLRDGLSEVIGAPLISSDGLLPEQGHVSTFNCCCIDGCSGTDQLDWLFVQIIWQSIQMLYFLYICAQKRLANKSGSRYSLFPADFSSTTSWIWIIAANGGDLHSIWHDIMISFDAKLLDWEYSIWCFFNIWRLIIFRNFQLKSAKCTTWLLPNVCLMEIDMSGALHRLLVGLGWRPLFYLL